MARRFTVLFTAVGRRGALVKLFRKALAEMGLDGRILGADLSATAPAMYLVDKGYLVPRATAPEYVDALESICRRETVDLVVPTIDPELPVLAEIRDRFSAFGTTLHVSAPATVAIGFSKDRTHQWLTEQGLPTVRQWSQAEAMETGNALPYPVVVKPRQGSASIGVSVAKGLDELRWAMRDGGEYVVQEKAPGREYTVSAYVDQSGAVRCLVPRLRMEVRAGEVSKGRSERNEPVRNVVRQLCEALPEAWGALNVQVFYEKESGTCRIIEMNPRFGGGYPLAWEAGAKFPIWLAQEVLGLECDANDEWEDGLTMLRYDEAVFVRQGEPDRFSKVSL